MKGVPLMRITPAVPAPPIVARPSASALGADPGGTYLNGVAARPGGIDPALVAGWRAELARPGLPAARRAWLQLWLGESRLAREEPDAAEGALARAARLGRGGPAEGIAAFDLAGARFYEGRYAEAAHELRALMKSPERGYDRRDAALLLRHASLCQGYHASRERLGVPEPPRLDPLCGVASMAVCLRALGLPYAPATVAAAVPHHGMGSSLAELARGARRLGLSPHALAVRRDAGLIALPKPVVAHVEHDHFVAVVDADAKGVEYVCSDCGRWPGGPVRLTWRQWDALEADAFLAPSRPGSTADLALLALERGQSPRDVGLVASRALPVPAAARQGAAVRTLLGALGTAVVAQTDDPGHPTVTCGQHPDSGKCVPCAVKAFLASLGFGSPYGAIAGDPVNLATAEEEYAPPVDLTVYNPTGPSVRWGRVYGSLSRYTSTLGEGWTHPYSLGVETTSTGNGGLAGSVVFPDGALMAFSGTRPTAASPHLAMTLGPGMPYLLAADYDAASAGFTFALTDEARTVWRTLAAGYLNDCLRGSTVYPVASETDRSGNSILFRYAAYAAGWVSGISEAAVLRLTEIDDAAGQALLTVGMDAQGWITSASDRYGRSVYYRTSDHNGTYPGGGQPPKDYQIPHRLLDAVSQIVPTGMSNPPVRAQYGYGDGPSEPAETVPYLTGASVPSPTGSGMSAMGFRYDAYSGFVTAITDANGNATTFRYAFTSGGAPSNPVTPDPDGGGGGASGPPPFLGTTVKVLGGTTTVRQYGVVSDMNMNPTQRVDAAGNTVWTKAYADPNTPYRPSAVTDANGRVWRYTWDRYGHPLTATTPKGTVTTYTYDYSRFALGELVSVREGAKTATAVSYLEPSGLPREVDMPVPGDVGAGATQATSYTYTPMGQVAAVTEPGSVAGTSRTTTYGYTGDGGYAQAEALGEPLTVTDALGKVWHTRYDARGNVASTWDPLGNETDDLWTLDDRVGTELSPATGTSGSQRGSVSSTYLYTGGPVTQFDVRDESGNVVRSTFLGYGPEGETTSRTGSAEEAYLAYDAAYATVSLTGRKGTAYTTTYAYDLNGRPTEIDYPLAASGSASDRVRFTGYDVVGNLLSRIDGNGQETDCAYGDADGRFLGLVPRHVRQRRLDGLRRVRPGDLDHRRRGNRGHRLRRR